MAATKTLSPDAAPYLVEEEEHVEALAKRLKPRKAKGSLFLAPSSPSSLARFNKPHVPTKTRPADWAKENSHSKSLDEDPDIEVDPATATTLASHTAQLGASRPTLSAAPLANMISIDMIYYSYLN
ncbi:hypothetical protein ACFE04_012793 [Oxalis oulophora]